MNNTTVTTPMTAFTLALIPLVVSTARPNSKDIYEYAVSCDANTNCQIGFYCSDAGQCEECVPCEKNQNRQSPPPVNGISCAKTFAECGSCLKGYEEQSLTDHSQMRKCSQIPTSWTSYEWNLCIIYIWLSVLSLLIGFIFREQLKKLLCICDYPKCKKFSDSEQNIELANQPPSNNQPNGQSEPKRSKPDSYQSIGHESKRK